MQKRKKYFDTYSCVNTSPVNGGQGISLQISRHCACCGKVETILWKVFDDADKAFNFSVHETETLNRHSVVMFLWYRPKILSQVFNLADVHGLILTRGLIQAGKKMKAPMVKDLPDMTDDRFISICLLLKKYGILQQIGNETFCSFIRGAY